MSEEESNDSPKKEDPPLLQVIGSVLSACVGIQTEKHFKRDFEEGSDQSTRLYFMVGTAAFIIITVVLIILAKLVAAS